MYGANDNELYYNVPTGGTHHFQFNAVDVVTFNATTGIILNAVPLSGITTLATTSTITGAGGTIRVSTAAAADASLVITRTVNTATEWFIYAPSGSTDLRFNHTGSGDRLTLTTAGAVSGIASLATTGGAWFGSAALATNATTGHVYIPTSAGAPTGTPAAKTGQVALQYDTTNNIIYVYNGAWKQTVALT
jgi:hypothetical protein